MTKECKCDMRAKLVGDGCSVCNPELTIEYMADEIANLKQERDELTAQVDMMRHALKMQESAENYAAQYNHLSAAADEIAGAFEYAHVKRLQALATTPSEALREIEARVLEHCAGYFRCLDETFPMTPPQIVASIERQAAAKRKGN